MLSSQRQDDKRAHRTGDQRGDGHALDAHAQQVDADGIAAKVDGVNDD